MGLDMFMTVRKYESIYSLRGKKWEDVKDTFYPPELAEIAKARGDAMNKSTEYGVAYWRKANAIHKWFVNNCGGGVDECQKMYVRPDQLETLICLCSEVCLDHTQAEKLLPTEDGFFFGGTAYDEWYFQVLEDTVKMLEPVLKLIKEHSEYEVYYEASW